MAANWRLLEEDDRGVHCLPKSHRWGVFTMAFNPDGTRLVTGDGDGKVCVWDVDLASP